MRGGPVEKGRGFVLHSSDYRSGNTYPVTPGVSLTATLDVLKAMAFGPAPHSSLFVLGCCGWSAGQLEDEIGNNGWLTAPFSQELVFETPVEDRYEAALASLHITRATLSPDAGHARGPSGRGQKPTAPTAPRVSSPAPPPSWPHQRRSPGHSGS
jgi:putative transcriptional regulator